MFSRETLVVAPSQEPFDVAAVKVHLRMSPTLDDEDALVAGWIQAARSRVEAETGLQLLTATWDFIGSEFAQVLEVPRPPLQSVVSITYLDTNGVSTVMDPADYVVDAPGGETPSYGRIEPAYGTAWPSTRKQFGAVRVRVVAGYGDDPEDIPALLRQAMLIAIGDFAEGRQSPQRLTGGAATRADDVSWRLMPFWVRPVLAAQCED